MSEQQQITETFEEVFMKGYIVDKHQAVQANVITMIQQFKACRLENAELKAKIVELEKPVNKGHDE